jgi:hypothetical protein
MTTPSHPALERLRRYIRLLVDHIRAANPGEELEFTEGFERKINEAAADMGFHHPIERSENQLTGGGSISIIQWHDALNEVHGATYIARISAKGHVYPNPLRDDFKASLIRILEQWPEIAEMELPRRSASKGVDGPRPPCERLSRTNAAEELGVQPGTVTRMIEAGRLKGQKNDRGEWEIDPDSVKAAKATTTRPAPPEVGPVAPNMITWECQNCDKTVLSASRPPPCKCGRDSWLRQRRATGQR